MIDEHTGAGGVLTRLEAFLETIERKKRSGRMG
jgi:predicted nucleotide-binding protein (sugar kinase/HSP70/actin superfamily)